MFLVFFMQLYFNTPKAKITVKYSDPKMQLDTCPADLKVVLDQEI